MYTFKRCIGTGKNPFPLDRRKLFRQCGGAVLCKRDDMWSRTQREDAADRRIRHTKREIDEQVNAIRTDCRRRFLSRHAANLTQRHFLCKDFGITISPCMICIDLKTLRIVREEVHRQQVTRTSRAEFRRQITDPHFLRHILCHSGCSLSLPLFHALSPSF